MVFWKHSAGLKRRQIAESYTTTYGKDASGTGYAKMTASYALFPSLLQEAVPYYTRLIIYVS
jgi:hypothetical protein